MVVGAGLDRCLWEFFTINVACNLRFTNPFILISPEVLGKEEMESKKSSCH